MVLKLKLSNGFKIYLVLLVVSFILFVVFYSYFPVWLKQTNIDNALYLLSSFIQGEAAVLGIVVTLSIVAIQLTASSYSTRAIGLLKESASLWILVLTFIIAIFYGSWVLKFTVSVDNISTNEFQIWIAFLLMIYAFTSLIPYLLDILNFTDPKTIIQLLSSKITKESLLSTLNQKVMYHYRPSGGPIQPLSDIMISALMKYDYGTLKDCLNSIENSMNKILGNRELNSVEESDVANHLFLHHFLRVGEVAVDKNDEESIVLILHSLSRLGIMAADLNYSFFSHQAAYIIGELGIKAILKIDNKRVLDHSQTNLGLVGENAADKGLENVVDWVLNWNFKICRTVLIENLYKPKYQDDLTIFVENEVYFDFNYNLLSGSIGLIDGIGRFALKQGNKTILKALIKNLSDIQKLNRKFNENNKYFNLIEEEIEKSLETYSD